MTNLLLILALLVLTAGCGNSGSGSLAGAGAVATVVQTPALPCSVTATEIVCPDGSHTALPTPIVGAKGDSGAQGAKGDAGTSCTAQTVAVGDSVLPLGGALVICGTGPSVLISNGAAGQVGATGATGATGGAGPTGAAATAPYSIVGFVNPCGNQGTQDEVFLRMSNGKLIASFSNDTGGTMTRLSELHDGVGYMTTDNTGCTFSLSTVGTTRTISWSGGSESWQVQ